MAVKFICIIEKRKKYNWTLSNEQQYFFLSEALHLASFSIAQGCYYLYERDSLSKLIHCTHWLKWKNMVVRLWLWSLLDPIEDTTHFLSLRELKGPWPLEAIKPFIMKLCNKKSFINDLFHYCVWKSSSREQNYNLGRDVFWFMALSLRIVSPMKLFFAPFSFLCHQSYLQRHLGDCSKQYSGLKLVHYKGGVCLVPLKWLIPVMKLSVIDVWARVCMVSQRMEMNYMCHSSVLVASEQEMS